jgi:type III secretion system TyeA family effector delivery regulator
VEQKKVGSQKFLEEDAVLGSIYASADFLLDALAEDLNAPIPSKEPAFLYLLNDRIRLVRSLVKELELTKHLLATIDWHFRNRDSLAPPRGTELDRADTLLRTLFKMLSQGMMPTAEVLQELAERVQIPPSPQAHVYFFTQLYQQIHNLPLRLFQRLEHREEVLCAIQDALDNAIVLEG